MKKNIILALVTLFAAYLILRWALAEIKTEEIWDIFFTFPPEGIFWILIFTIIGILLSAWRWKIILEDRGCNLSFKKVVGSWIAGFGLDYFTPFAILGGETFRGYFLNKRYNVPLGKGIVSIIIDKILDGSIFFLIIILGIIFFVFETFTIPVKLLTILFLVFFPVVGIIVFYFKAFKSQSMVKVFKKPIFGKIIGEKLRKNIIIHEEEVFNFFEKDNINVKKAVVISFLKGTILWLRSFGIIYFLGIKISAIQSLIVVAFTNLAYLFPMPAAIGSHEVLQIFSFSKLGFVVGGAVAFTLILRAFDLLVGLIGLFIAFKFGASRMKEMILNN